MNTRAFFILSFIVAGLLHIWLAKVYVPGFDFTGHDKKETEAPIELAPLDSKGKPIVQSQRAEENESLKDKEARFGGEFKNRVEKETKSPLVGRLRRGGSGSQLFDERGQPSLSDLLPFGSSPNALPPDISDGNETVLNTDPIRYGSFINRIADQIYDPWVGNINKAVEELYLHGRKLEANVYVTKLVVMMTPSGEINAIQLSQSSGVKEIDEASKRAFWRNKEFPRPPAQMVGEDGYIRLPYEFHFEWKTASFRIVPWEL